ncbi:MAG: hypothetical protein JNK25_00715 [Phycisphaerae bacterium]|nr:hypothetical protein [Phycisphaerae bacterium]
MNHARIIRPLLAAGIFASAVLAVIASGRIPHRVAYDQKLYHEEAVRIFAAQWPSVDVTDYLSATTPGFHLVLAAGVRYLGLETRGLQVLCALIGAALVGVLAAQSRGGGVWRTLAMVLPVVASMYIFASGAWILPDNAAWLGVAGVVLLALRERVSVTSVLLMGMVLAALVLVRQVHLWAAGVVIAAAYLGDERGNDRPDGWRSVAISDWPGALIRALVAVLACVPALLIVIGFYGLWGGLVPPSFQFQYRAANPAGPAFLLAVIGAVSLFYAGFLWPRIRAMASGCPAWLAGAGMIGLVLGVLPRTTVGAAADYAAGRRTGLWDVVAAVHQRLHVPQVGHISPVIAGLCVLGAVAVAAWLGAWTARQRLIWLAALAGYSAAFSAGGELWQRYAEPFALIFVVLSAMRCGTEGAAASDTERRSMAWRIAPCGPLLLALAFAALTARDLRKADTRHVTDPAPPAETSAPGEPPPRPDSPWSRYMIAHQRHPAFKK